VGRQVITIILANRLELYVPGQFNFNPEVAVIGVFKAVRTLTYCDVIEGRDKYKNWSQTSNPRIHFQGGNERVEEVRGHERLQDREEVKGRHER